MGIHRSPVDSPYKYPVIYWFNGFVADLDKLLNSRFDDDLRSFNADVTSL